MDLEIAINEFLEYLEIERNVSKLTIRNYRHYLERFCDFLANYGQDSPNDNKKKDKQAAIAIQIPSPGLKNPAENRRSKVKLSEVNSESIRQFRLYLARYEDGHGLTLKRVTQNYHLIAIRSFLKYMMKRDQPVVSPEKIDLPKAESRSIKFLEREQVERLLSMPEISTKEGLRDKAILEVLFSTGLRVSELTRLNRDQINFERREFGVIGKGRRARIVFLSPNAAEWLKRYLGDRTDSQPPLFIRYSGKTPDPSDKLGETYRLTPRSVQRLVEKYVKKAKLPVKITPHGLRHSFATDLLTGGADLRAIQEMLGHKNVSTTQIYTHITNPQLRSIHERFHRQKS